MTMPRVLYKSTNFKPDALSVISRANAICAEYGAQGLDLTLRQLYYQFVSRDWIPNKQTEYKRLGDIINKARYAGLLDWTYIVDRTRNLRDLAHWDDVPNLMLAVSQQFRTDRWENQPTRVEVWIEKDALVGVLQAVCPGLDVPYFSCRGYTSSSEIWSAAQRLGEYVEKGQNVIVVHLGDHDPSGVDMTRDIEDRIRDFMLQDFLNASTELGTSCTNGEIRQAMAERCGGRTPLEIRRIALNMDQIEEYQPPPNPAKMTDSRATGYVDLYGYESWELDALDPTTLIALITETIEGIREDEQWDLDTEHMESEREVLAGAARNWDEVRRFMEEELPDGEA
jgi:hypothetical protein